MVIPPELPDDYPPRIGGMVAVLNGQGMVWDTYDWSVGVFDSSVQITDFNGETRFFLTGEQVGQPNIDEKRLRLFALMTGPGQRRALQSAEIEFIEGAWDGPRLSSSGSAAEVVLDHLILDQGGYGGQVKGNFSATLCEGNAATRLWWTGRSASRSAGYLTAGCKSRARKGLLSCGFVAN